MEIQHAGQCVQGILIPGDIFDTTGVTTTSGLILHLPCDFIDHTVQTLERRHMLRLLTKGPEREKD